MHATSTRAKASRTPIQGPNCHDRDIIEVSERAFHPNQTIGYIGHSADTAADFVGGAALFAIRGI
jgi:hypothetical protein